MKIGVSENSSLYDILKNLNKKKEVKAKFDYEYIGTDSDLLDKMMIVCKVKLGERMAVSKVIARSTSLDEIRELKKEAFMIATEDLGIYIYLKDEDEDIEEEEVKEDDNNTEYNEDDSEQECDDDAEEDSRDDDEDCDDEDDGTDSEDDDSDDEEEAPKQSKQPSKKTTGNGISKEQNKRYKELLQDRQIKTIKRLNEVLTAVREDYDIDVHTKDDLNGNNIDEILDAIDELTEGYTF